MKPMKNTPKLSPAERALLVRAKQLALTEEKVRGVRASIRYQLGDLFVSLVSNPHHPLLLAHKIRTLLTAIKNRIQVKRAACGRNTSLVHDDHKESSNLGSPLAVEHKKTKRPFADLVVGLVADDFTTACLEPECHVIALRADQWKQQLKGMKLDLLFVESAWWGKQKTWHGQIETANLSSQKSLLKLASFCADKNIPTVFWNKEDPVHLPKFLAAAEQFDFVFTTDENAVPVYQILLGHERIWPLPFAASPYIHFPPQEDTQRTTAVAFAGSWNERDHPHRCKRLAVLLNAAKEFDLCIYDRNHGTGNQHVYPFPKEYQPFIKGRLPYHRMVETYRKHKVFLNVVSVEDSPTMCSRRVFELLACGACVVSAPSKGIETMFGEIVQIARTKEQAQETLRTLINNDVMRCGLAEAGVAHVLEHHTMSKRLAFVLDKVGL